LIDESTYYESNNLYSPAPLLLGASHLGLSTNTQQ
jgi:hypothetical protein